MRLSVQNNFPAMATRLQQLGRQAPFVAAVSLTRTIKDVLPAEQEEMREKFVGVTKYALNGMFVKPATKKNLEARIWVKDNPFGKGTPADRFLLPEIYGGARGQKGMERLLQRQGLMPAGWFAIPAAGAQMDANGNVKRSQIIQILSQLKVQRSAGYESRATGSARSNRTIARQGVTYFALAKKHRGLGPGIYLKRKFALGTSVRPVFIFESAAHYRVRMRFHEVGERTAYNRFPVHFNNEWRKAVASVRLR